MSKVKGNIVVGVFRVLLILVGLGGFFLPLAGQQWEWVRSIQDTDIQIGVATAADPVSGAVYVAGTFRGGISSLGFTSAGQEDIVLARYRADGTLDWAIQIGAASGDFATDLAVDSTGAVFMSGSYQQSVDFRGNGPTPLTLNSLGVADAFLAKYDSLGRVVWAQSMGQTGTDLGNSVAVSGNRVYITGNYLFAIDFNGGSSSLVSMGGFDAFVAQYDTAGNFSWAQTIGGGSADAGTSVTADASGVYVSGTYMGLNATILTPTVPILLVNSLSGATDMFLTHLRLSDGLATWGISMGSTGNDACYGSAVDGSQVYLVGEFPDTCTFSTLGPAASSGGTDFFISAFDKVTGLGAWLFTNGQSTGNDQAWDVAVTDTSVWVSGNYSGSITFVTDVLPAIFFEDLFVAQFTSAGIYTWSGYAGSNGSDLGRGIAVAPSAVYVAGSYSNFSIAYFPSSGLNLPNQGSTDMFLGRISFLNSPPPVAVDDSLSILVDSPWMVPVLANDLNPGGGTVTVSNACAPSNGITSIVNDSILYTPNPGFVGIDSFCYTICDTVPQCDSAWVYVNVVDLPPDVNPPPAPQLLTTGCLVIAMDSVLQQDGGNLFNLYTYGLANALLKANIPLKWCITSGKGRDGIDFSANAAREFPSPLPVAMRDFIGGPLVIDSTYSDSAIIVINAYNGAVPSPVSVYRLSQDVTTDVRHVLTHKPNVAVFTNGGSQGIHVNYLSNAGFPNSDFSTILASAVSFDSVACYTFASDPGWASTNLNDTAETRRVRLFLEYGGNFLAQNDAIGTYEFLEGFQTTAGITRAPIPADIYQNPDMPYLQVHGPIQNANGTYPAFVPRFGSAFLPGAYTLIHHQGLAHFRATAAKVGTSLLGGECFYLGGMDYGLSSNRERNGRRMYLDAVLVPPRRPATCDRDFSCDIEVEKGLALGNYCVGDTVLYQIVVTNLGPGTAIAVQVQDTLPAGLNYSSSFATQGAYSSGTSTWTLGDIAYLESDTLFIRAVIGSVGTFTNTAHGSASKFSPEFTLGNNVFSVTFTSLSTPDPTISPINPLCTNNPALTLNAATTGGSWSGTGVSGNVFDPGQSGAGAFTVTYNVATGQCSAVDSISVLVNAAPLVSLGADTSACTGDSITLSSLFPANAYLWSTSATTSTLTVGSPGTYKLIVTDTNNCSATDTVEVSFLPLPVFSIGPDSILCQGDSLVLDPMLAASAYAWSNFATTQSITVFSTGSYALTLTDGNNCQASDTALVTFLPPPVINFSGPVGFCPGDSAVLNPNAAAASYLWSTSETTPTITVSSPGVYYVTVSSGSNCMATDSVSVSLYPAPPVELGADTSACTGDSITLSSLFPANAYLWNTTATTSTLTVGSPGAYELTVTDANNCSAADTVNVSFLPLPVFSIGPDSILCQGDSLVLDPMLAASAYAWSTFATTQSITVFSSGSYALTLTDGNSCQASDTALVTFLPPPVINFGGPVGFCPGDSAVLNPNVAPATYLWSTSQTSPTITVNAPGLYSVTVTIAAGCQDIDSVMVSQFAPPMVDASGNPGGLCSNDPPATLTGSPSGGTFLGPGVTGSSLNPSQVLPGPQNYVYTITDQNGCNASDTFVVQIYPLPMLNMQGPEPEYCVSDPDDTLNFSPSGGVLAGPGIVNYAFSPLLAGPGGPFNFTYTYTDSNSCRADLLAYTYVRDLPTPADAGPDQALHGANTTSMSANAPLNGTGLWSLVNGNPDISSASDPNAIISGLSAGETALVWTISAGACGESSDTVLILINELVIPTGFSPNGDLVNDLYVVNGIEKFATRYLRVFNRWGNLVYSSDNYANTWNGADNDGRPLSDDTYYIVLDLGHDGKHSQTVCIKR